MVEKDRELERLFQAFAFLRDSDEEIRDELERHIVMTKIPGGEFIFIEGDECKQLALVLSGSVRVYKPAESGKEITLYRLGTGDSCILTASCIFARSSFPAIAVTEEEVEAAVIPAYVFRSWINRYEPWRNYIFNLLAKRLSEIMVTLEEVAFRRMDIRIAKFLLRSSENNKNGVKIRHQDIAMELGSSREVISRILKHFEYENLIVMKRGTIMVQDADKLLKIIHQGHF